MANNASSRGVGKVKATSKSAALSPAKIQRKQDKKAISFVVQGQVRMADGAAKPGLTVKAFDRNVGADDRLLGQGSTDIQGHYSISYSSDKLRGKPAADLVVSVYQDATPLQNSDVIFNAQPVETRDFIIPGTLAPEFQRILDKIRPLLAAGIGLGKLGKKQINFLSRKTGIDANKIGWLAESYSLGGINPTSRVFYYGLLSQNFPTDPGAILGRSRDSINRALEIATATGQIPALEPAEVDHILNEELPKVRAEN